MAKGISVYFGEQSYSEIEEYVILANKIGYKKVFTSLHLPEVDFKPLLEDFSRLGLLCYELGMSLMVDVSPKTFSYFTFNKFIKYMVESRISLIRIDFGLEPEKIVKLSNSDSDFKIVLNASAVLSTTFEMLLAKGLNKKNVEMCHNFYPRPETGIYEEYFSEQNNYYKKYDMKISAFIAAKTGKRAPVFEGLPTLENHRYIRSSLAFRYLQLLEIDNIYFGDNNVDIKELEAVAKLNDSAVALESTIYTENPEVKSLLNLVHTDRPDNSELVIRSQESRLTLSSGKYTKCSVNPENNIERLIGHITMDNNLYERYAGELQICRKNLKADKRVNVIGKVNEDNLFLLPYIKKAKRYYFINGLDY